VHGTFFVELYKFAGKKLGSDKWNALLENSAYGAKVYATSAEYPHQEMAGLISTIADMTGSQVAVVWEDFGQFVAEDLAKVYGGLLEPAWKTLDVLENVGLLAPRIFREIKPDGELPGINFTRSGPAKATISYDSSRKLCGLIKGAVKGVANHFGERVLVEETGCMLNGAASCEIVVELLK
jgi:predicted hydrocarbon binding protein